MQSGPYDAGTVDDHPGPLEPLRATFTSDVSHPSLWRGILLGLLATAVGLGIAELVVGVVEGSSSPVVPVGQEFIDYTPRWLKNWAIEQFGTSDKAVLITGALIVILFFGAIIGVLAVRGALAMAYVLTAAVGVIGAWAVVIRPEPTLAKLLPTIVGTLVSFAVLWWLAPRRGPSDTVGRPTMIGPDRRQFLQGAVGIGSMAAIAGGLGWTLRRRFEIDAERSNLVLPKVVPDQAAPAVVDEFSLGVDGIVPFVVPNDRFYRIDTALVVPQVAAETWKLKIGGLVDRPLELTFDDLLARPQIERHITLSCVSNPIGGDLVGNALWQGVRLADILDEAGLQDGAEQVVSRSVDGWTCGSPIEAIMDGRDAMLAIAMNGEPLPSEHGYPVRIVVPGLFGYVSATKWVTDITLTRWEDYDAYWVPRGWSKLGPVKTMARIDTPRSGRSASGTLAIGGVAWAVHRGVSGVEIRIDGGDWRPAEIGTSPSADTWVQWEYRWDTSEVARGKHTVEVRAIDGNDDPQPEEPKAVAPDGAQGYHRISVDTK